MQAAVELPTAEVLAERSVSHKLQRQASNLIEDSQTNTRAQGQASAALVITLLGFVPALVCLYIFYSSSGDCNGLREWLLVNGYSCVAMQTISLIGLAFLPQATALGEKQGGEAGAPPSRIETPSATYRALQCLSAPLYLFLFVWWVIGNVRLWGADSSSDGCADVWPATEEYFIYTYIVIGLSCCAPCLFCFVFMCCLPSGRS